MVEKTESPFFSSYDEYESIQISRSELKRGKHRGLGHWTHVYTQLFKPFMTNEPAQQIVCMGVRAGEELDAFRALIGNNCVLTGVELNPHIHRPDVLNADYSKLPANWTNKFDVVYSNSLDHAYDIDATLAEWIRVAKPGGLLILELSTVGPAGPTQPNVFTSDDFSRFAEKFNIELKQSFPCDENISVEMGGVYQIPAD